MVFQNDILAGAAGAGGGYTIDQSIRFNRDDSAYLTRTPSSASNRRTFTLSFWWKMCTIPSTTGGGYRIITAGSTEFGWSDTNDAMYLNDGSVLRATNQVFRDVSAWQHIVIAADTTSGTADDRLKLYINGEQVTSWLTNNTISQNFDFDINNTVAQNIGKEGANYIDAYVAEFHSVDGTQLDATSFGETNNDGVWIPKAYSGSYGTNGFYLKGQDSADLGNDSSGNGNDFTSSGLTSADQVSDSPTDTYAVYNNIIKGENSYHAGGYGWGSNTISEGGLKVLGPTGTNLAGATISYPSSGKFYYEATYIGTDSAFFGIADLYDDTKAVWYRNNGWVSENSSSWNTSSGAASYSAGDVLAIAVNMDGNEAKFYKNNSLQSTVSLTAGSTYTPVLFGGNSSIGFSIDFGQLGFTYTPPTGFTALSTANLPAPTIKDGSAHFNTILYTGDGSATTRSFTGVGFQPDFVWKKIRSSADHHWLHDAVRGATKGLNSNRTDSEYTSNRLTSFDSDGFSFATSDPDTNGSGSTYVAWNWLAGNGTASNSDGTLTSTVSANTTAGFSVVGYTGNGTAGATVGHGLGVSPDLLIVKNRDNTEQWIVYHRYNGGTKYLLLNSNAAAATSSGAWNNTDPSSSVVTLGGGGFGTNVSSNNMIMYAFAETEGFSRIGNYTGNGSASGPFIWCGFRPAFVVVKENTSADDWVMYDSTRDPYNVAGRVLRCDSNAAEFDGRGGSRDVDFLSNGFKFRSSNATMNGSGVGYVFFAFAEHPFGGNGVAPVPAR